MLPAFVSNWSPFLHRSYPVSQVLRTPPPPHTARSISHELPVDPTAITAGASRVASGLLYVHAVAITPAGSMEHVRSSLSIVGGLPREKVGSAPATVFSGPAQRSLTLRPARSLSRLPRPFFIGVFQRKSLPPPAAPTASGWSDQLAGWDSHPLEPAVFARHTVRSRLKSAHLEGAASASRTTNMSAGAGFPQ